MFFFGWPYAAVNFVWSYAQPKWNVQCVLGDVSIVECYYIYMYYEWETTHTYIYMCVQYVVIYKENELTDSLAYI